MASPETGLPDAARAVLDAVNVLNSDLDLPLVLDRIVRSACAITDARYGALGDYRPQPHGGFESRTLPSWLVSPAAAKAAFALALLCAREALRIPRLPAQEERFAEAYYAGDRAELAGCLDAVAATVGATDSYPALARYIEPLFDAARRGKTWDESVDIRGKWRIEL